MEWHDSSIFLTQKLIAERLTPEEKNTRNVKTAAKGSSIANHAWSHDHSMDLNNGSVIDKGNFRIRKTLESWHSMVTPNADNNSCPIQHSFYTYS